MLASLKRSTSRKSNKLYAEKRFAESSPSLILHQAEDFHQLFPPLFNQQVLEKVTCSLAKESHMIHGNIYLTAHNICFSSNSNSENFILPFYNITNIEKNIDSQSTIQIETETNCHVLTGMEKIDELFTSLNSLWDVQVPPTSTYRKFPVLSGACICNDLGTCQFCYSEFKNEKTNPLSISSISNMKCNCQNLGTCDYCFSELSPKLKKSISTSSLKRKTNAKSSTHSLPLASAFPTEIKTLPITRHSTDEKKLDEDVFSFDVSLKSKSLGTGSLKSFNDVDHEFTVKKPLQMSETKCEFQEIHQSNTIGIDKIFQTSLDNIFKIIFNGGDDAPFSTTFTARFITSRKCKEIMVGDWKSGEQVLEPDSIPKKTPSFNDDIVGKTRSMEYIMALSNPLGPKQTKCVLTESIISLDPETHICIETITRNPDVPSGTCFHTVTRVCYTKCESGVRAVGSYKVVFTKSTWLRAPVEKGAADGLKSYFIELEAALLNEIEGKTDRRNQDRKDIEKVAKHFSGRRKRSSLRPVNTQLPNSNGTKTPESFYLGVTWNHIAVAFFINMLLLLIVNFFIVLRLSLVLERYDERVSILVRLVEELRSNRV